MYTDISEEFGQLVTSNGRTWKARIVVGEDVVEDILSIEVNRGSVTGDSIEIGTAVAGYVEIIVNSTLIFEDKEILLEEGLVLSDGTTEYIPVGKFGVTKAVSKGERVTISATDILATKAESIYVTTLTDTAEMVQEICAYLGISFEGELEGLTIEPPTGLTKREALGYLAGLYGKFACVNRYGNLVFKWYEDTYLISRDDVEEPDLSQNDFTVNKLVVNNGSTEFTAGTSSSTGIFNSNPLMTEDLIEGAYSGLAGFKYRPGTINLILGDPRLDPWDMISYEDYILICGKITDVYDGGVKTTINSPGKTESESETDYKGPTAKALERYYAELVLVNEALVKKLDVEQLDAVKADIESAVIEELGTEFLTVTAADVKYADIKLANIDIADIGTFLADCGLIDRADIVEGHVTGFLDSVEVNANKITAGTLIADRILLSGEKTGVLYALNNLGDLTSETVDTLDGYVLTDRTITADKIVANSITANEIDVEDLFAQDITATGTIRGAKIIGGEIQSNNFTMSGSNVTSGMIIDLTNGYILAPNVRILSTGTIKLTDLNVSGYIKFEETAYEDTTYGTITEDLQINTEGIILTKETTTGTYGYLGINAGSIYISSSIKGGYLKYDSDGLLIDNIAEIAGATTLKDTLNVNGVTTLGSALNVQGIVTFGNETTTIKLKSSTYTSFLYNNGSNTYMLLSNEGADNWNSLRPLTINNTSGNVTLGGVLLINPSGNYVTSTGNIVLTSNNTFLYGVNSASTQYALIGLNSSNRCSIAPDFENIRIGTSPTILSHSGTMQIGASNDSYITYLSGSEVWVCNSAKTAYKVIKASAFTISSTKKLKENILPMSDEEAKKIYKLDVVSFDYINGEKNQHGLIAEDVANVFPSLVYGDLNATDKEGIMRITLNYVGLIPYLLKELQQHENKINKLINNG